MGRPSCSFFFFTTLLLLSIYVGILTNGGPFTSPICVVTQRLALNTTFCPKTKVAGYVAPGFEPVRETFQNLFDEGFDLGSQLTVYHKNHVVVDLYGGWTDQESFKEFNHETLSVVFSVSKVISSLVIGMLVDQGSLKYDDPISRYWPEFGKHGKEDITIEELMKHEAGLAITPTRLSYATLGDLDQVAKYLEDLTPTEAHQRSYHALTRDLITNELVRRVDKKKRSIGKFIREEIAQPLGIEFYVGEFPHSLLERLSVNYPTPRLWSLVQLLLPNFFPEKFSWGWGDAETRAFTWEATFNASSLFYRSIWGAVELEKEGFNGVQFRSVELGSANGISNSRSIAKLAALIANGGEFEGRRLFSSKTGELIAGNATIMFDKVFGRATKFTRGGWGVFLNTLGWNGLGGTAMRWIEKDQIGIGFVPNCREPAPYERYPRLEKKILECMKGGEKAGISKEQSIV